MTPKMILQKLIKKNDLKNDLENEPPKWSKMGIHPKSIK